MAQSNSNKKDIVARVKRSTLANSKCMPLRRMTKGTDGYKDSTLGQAKMIARLANQFNEQITIEWYPK